MPGSAPGLITISEMIFVPDSLADGQVPAPSGIGALIGECESQLSRLSFPLTNDCSPS